MDHNRFALVYKRPKYSTDRFPWFGGRAWFSFVIDGKYFSFNFVNIGTEGPGSLTGINSVLMIQHLGPFEEKQWWDTHWIDFDNRKKDGPWEWATTPDPDQTPRPDSDSSFDWVKMTRRKKREIPIHLNQNHTPTLFENHIKMSHLFNELNNEENTNKSQNSYDPERERKLQLRRSDGLLQYVLYHNFRNFSLGHNLLLLKGHRDKTTVARITVTFQFTTKFMVDIALKNYNQVMPLIAIRTINELNAIFKRSGTLIKLYIGCIKISTIWGDAPGLSAKDVLEAYSAPSKYCSFYQPERLFPKAICFLDERVTNDLLIVFVRDLNHLGNTISYPYGYPEGKSVVIVNSRSFLETYDIAHEIGHVLGAGHTPDPVCKFYLT